MRKSQLAMFLLGIALALLGILFCRLPISYAFSITALVLVVTASFIGSRNMPIKYFFELFYCLFATVGVFMCNVGGLYLIELRTRGFENGSFPVIVLYYVFFWTALSLFERKMLAKEAVARNDMSIKTARLLIIRIAILALGLILFIPIINKPSFMYDMDRFRYQNSFLGEQAGTLANVATCLLPLLLLSDKNESRKKRFVLTFACLAPFILYGIWTGNKFGLFFNIIILFASIIAGNSKGGRNNKRKSNVGAIILIISIIMSLLVSYYVMRGMNPVEAISERSAQQGQLLWAVNNADGGKMRIDEIEDEIMPVIDAFKNEPVRKTYGVYKMMAISTPYEVRSYKLSTGSRYSSQGVDIAYYYFGYLGVIIHAILRAYLEVVLVNLLIAFFKRKDLVGVFSASYLILMKHSIFTQGDLYKIFGTIFVICLFLVVSKVIIRKRNK